jgi:hypothetical protein
MIRKTVRRSIGKEQRLRNVTKGQVKQSLEQKHALNSNYVRFAFIPAKAEMMALHLRGIFGVKKLISPGDIDVKKLDASCLKMMEHYGVSVIYAEPEAADMMIQAGSLKKMSGNMENLSWGSNVSSVCKELKIRAIINKNSGTVYFLASKNGIELFEKFEPNGSDYSSHKECPSLKELRRFASGGIRGVRVEKHLEGCPRCNDLMGEIWSGNQAGKLGKIDLEV